MIEDFWCMNNTQTGSLDEHTFVSLTQPYTESDPQVACLFDDEVSDFHPVEWDGGQYYDDWQIHEECDASQHRLLWLQSSGIDRGTNQVRPNMRSNETKMAVFYTALPSS